MRSKGVAQLLGNLGVTKPHSRSHVSSDNPFFRKPVQAPQIPAPLPQPVQRPLRCAQFLHGLL